MMYKKSRFIREWYVRLKAETPPFFRKVRRIGKRLIIFGTCIVVPEFVFTPEEGTALAEMWAITTKVAHYALFGGGLIVAVSSAACAKVPDAEEPA